MTTTNYVAAATEALLDALRAQGIDPDTDLTPMQRQLYTLLVLTRGETTTLADVHDAWGCARILTRPDHPSLVPFECLSYEVAEWDRPFMLAIHAAARTVRVNRIRGLAQPG
jgi:hypothetical protein